MQVSENGRPPRRTTEYRPASRIRATIAKLLALLLIGSWAWAAAAGEVAGLYESRLAVESQSREERQDALREAFEQVLIKVSGHRDVLQKAAVRSELNRHTNYLVQYNYANEGGQLYLRAQFDENSIESLLRRADATYWNPRRPDIMFWIAADATGPVQLVGRDDDNAMIDALREQAAWRALPISFPLLDLSDRMQVSPSDVWGRFDAPVLEASQRYEADGIVMLRLQPDNSGNSSAESEPGWRAQWTLLVGNTRRHGQNQATSLEELGRAVADDVTERVAAEYAVTFGEASEGDLTIRVTDLLTLESVLEVEALLGRLGAVERVTLTRYHQGTAEFKLRLLGEMSRAMQALELENRMQRVVDPWSATASPVVEYQWRQ